MTEERAQADPAPHRFIFTINSSGVMTPYVDGVAGTTNTNGGNWISAGTAQIGRQDAGTGSYWSGPIAEADIATGYSDATAVAALDIYLKDKWGL